MIVSKALAPRPRNGVEVRELDWEQVQGWFQRTFFSGEDLPSNQRTAEQESPIAAAHRILTNAMSVMPMAIYQRRDGGRYPRRPGARRGGRKRPSHRSSGPGRAAGVPG